MTKPDRMVLAVLAYSAQFHHPLSEREILQRLITTKGLTRLDEWLAGKEIGQGIDSAALKKILNKLIARGKICRSPKKLFGAYRYTLAQRNSAFDRFTEARAQQKKRQPIVQEFIQVVEKIPWVKAVVMTGSLAAGGGRVGDDVDFMIVTQNNRLWLTRFGLILISWWRGRRPNLGKDLSKSWDLNLWLDERCLSMVKNRRSLYEAYEILQTKWIYDSGKIEQRFKAQNSWVEEYLVNWRAPKVRPRVKKTGWAERIWSFGNFLAYCFEVGYRTFRHGKQNATLGTAFFHQGSTRAHIFRRWKRLYNTVK